VKDFPNQSSGQTSEVTRRVLIGLPMVGYTTRMRFSLALMLICTAILAVVIAVCVAVPVHVPATQIVTKNRFDEARETTIAFDRQPTGAEVAMRLARSGPLAMAVFLFVRATMRRCVSRSPN
jgi:hypothetical protein